MSTVSLQQTIRRCTAVVVLALTRLVQWVANGLDIGAQGADILALLLVLGSVASLVLSFGFGILASGE